MRTFLLIITLGIRLMYSSPAAEQIVDFTGTWLLDPEHSTMDISGPSDGKLKFNTSGGAVSVRDAGDPPPAVFPAVPPLAHLTLLTLQIVQTEDEVETKRKFMLEGKERTILQKFATDGSRCFNLSSDGTSEFVSRSSWKKDKLTHAGIQSIAVHLQRTEAHVTEEYSLSKNGKKLTIKTMLSTPQGVLKFKQEFIRQKKEDS